MREAAALLGLSPELLEEIAERTAKLVLERLAFDGTLGQASPYLTVAEAAELYRCKPQRIYELLHEGRLQGLKEGGRVLLERAELERRLVPSARAV